MRLCIVSLALVVTVDIPCDAICSTSPACCIVEHRTDYATKTPFRLARRPTSGRSDFHGANTFSATEFHALAKPLLTDSSTT
jgi:hypothetical protein